MTAILVISQGSPLGDGHREIEGREWYKTKRPNWSFFYFY